MATKKSPKKSTAKKPAAKKPATKKPVAKKTTRSTAKAKKSKDSGVIHGSFTIQASKQPFFSFRLTSQTLYWGIFSLTILFFGAWVINLHMSVEDIYNQIELNQAYYDFNNAELLREKANAAAAAAVEAAEVAEVAE